VASDFAALMPPAYFDNPKHWRDRAEEARAVADQLTDLEAKRMMLVIAADYAKLAERAEGAYAVLG
jgi:hypothetical protein